MDARTRRLHETRLVAFTARLAAGGLGARRAARLVEAWGDEAARLGIGETSPGWWSRGEAWIRARAAEEQARG